MDLYKGLPARWIARDRCYKLHRLTIGFASVEQQLSWSLYNPHCETLVSYDQTCH